MLSEHTVLLGINNSGKSTIVDAIGYLLGREKLVRDLGDYDFHGGNPTETDRIHIKGIITGFNKEDPSLYPDWFSMDKGGVPVWYNIKTGEVDTQKKENFQLAVEIGFCARFVKETLEYEYERYFVTSNVDPFLDSNIYPIRFSILKDLGFFLIPSRRNWEKLISFNSELFRKVIRFQDAIPGESILNIKKELSEIENKIEEVSPFKDIVERLNHELEGFLEESSKLNFLPTDGDVENVQKSLTPFLKDKNSLNLPLGTYGSGVISLQTLLLLLEFGRYRKNNNQNFILCAEEPELHLHPGIHRRLVSRIRGLCHQTILTTHSPEIASYYKPNEIKILQNKDGNLSSPSMLKVSSSFPTANALMRLITIYRQEVCDALMYKNILIPEGITEYYWLKSLIKTCYTAEGWESYKIENEATKSFGIIPTQSANIEPTYDYFENLVDNVIPIVDGDEAGMTYIRTLLGKLNKPKIILRLPLDQEIENLITWIITPLNTEENAKLVESFPELQGTSLQEIAEYLKQNKTNWQIHENILELIVQNENYFTKTQILINSISLINNLPDTLNRYWSKEEELSNDETTVLTFNFI